MKSKRISSPEGIWRKAAELICEPRTDSCPQILPPFLYTAHLHTGSEEKMNSFDHNQVWSVTVLPPGWKTGQHFKVKFGADGCHALLPGGFVATGSQLSRDARVQAHAQASNATSSQPLEG